MASNRSKTGRQLNPFVLSGTSPPANKSFFENQIGTERLLTKRSLAELIDVSVSFVNKLMKCEGLPHIKLGKSVRFRASEVMAFLKSRRRP